MPTPSSGKVKSYLNKNSIWFARIINEDGYLAEMTNEDLTAILLTIPNIEYRKIHVHVSLPDRIS